MHVHFGTTAIQTPCIIELGNERTAIRYAESWQMPFQLIENYGVIRNMQSVAFVGMNGSIDFFCYAEFDSPSVFAVDELTDYVPFEPDREQPNEIVRTVSVIRNAIN